MPWYSLENLPTASFLYHRSLVVDSVDGLDLTISMPAILPAFGQHQAEGRIQEA